MLARRCRRVNVSCLLGYESTDQQTRDAIPIPDQCWARVTDPGPTPAPANVTCSLGMHGKSNYGGNDYPPHVDYFDYEHMNNIMKLVTPFQHNVKHDKSNMTQFLNSPITAEEI